MSINHVVEMSLKEEGTLFASFLLQILADIMLLPMVELHLQVH